MVGVVIRQPCPACESVLNAHPYRRAVPRHHLVEAERLEIDVVELRRHRARVSHGYSYRFSLPVLDRFTARLAAPLNLLQLFAQIHGALGMSLGIQIVTV